MTKAYAVTDHLTGLKNIIDQLIVVAYKVTKKGSYLYNSQQSASISPSVCNKSQSIGKIWSLKIWWTGCMMKIAILNILLQHSRRAKEETALVNEETKEETKDNATPSMEIERMAT